MSRERSFLQMLEASSKIQLNIALILEAKAVEAEKIRNWIVNCLDADALHCLDKQLSVPMQIHGQIVELLEGMTKLENGMCSNLKAVLEGQGSGEGGGFGMGEMDR
ncbi:hypothetical protein J2T13_001629 [Paenibacillus sp. DS2015]|uniref:restriction endonuclease subunit S n=1 Tax=Paenibacillus sp. DS2015 TaxID=3373917 RepID=UPI003D1F6A66